MKQSVSVMLAGMMLVQAPLAFAQNQNAGAALPVINATPAGAGSTIIFGPSGQQTLNQTIQNNSDVAKEVLKQTQVTIEMDRTYLLGIVERMNNHLLEMAKLKLDFTTLSQKSSGIAMVQLEDYLDLVNRINNIDTIIRTEMQTQSVVGRDTLPSYDTIQAGEMKVSVATAGNIKMQPVMDKVEIARASMMTQMNALKFPNMVTRLGQSAAVTENALTPNLSGIRVLTEAEIKEKRALIQEKLTLSEDTNEYAKRYVDLLVTQLNNFIKDYGINESMRFRNDNDKTARAAAFKQIADAFFRRSYLRRKYNVRLGAIRTATYDKKFANTEDFRLQPLWIAATSLQRVAATTQPDVLTAFEDVRNWVELYDKKLTPVFKSKEEIMKNPEKLQEYASKNTGALIRLNSMINTITGQDSAAEALLMVMRLILSDTTEEMMLYTNQDEALANYHNAHYRSTAEAKAEYNKEVCSFDAYLTGKVIASVCGGKQAKLPQLTSGKSTLEISSSILFQFETVEKGRRQEADFATKLVQAAIRAGQTDAQKQQEDDEINDMFK